MIITQRLPTEDELNPVYQATMVQGDKMEIIIGEEGHPSVVVYVDSDQKPHVKVEPDGGSLQDVLGCKPSDPDETQEVER